MEKVSKKPLTIMAIISFSLLSISWVTMLVLEFTKYSYVINELYSGNVVTDIIISGVLLLGAGALLLIGVKTKVNQDNLLKSKSRIKIFLSIYGVVGLIIGLIAINSILAFSTFATTKSSFKVFKYSYLLFLTFIAIPFVFMPLVFVDKLKLKTQKEYKHLLWYNTASFVLGIIGLIVMLFTIISLSDQNHYYVDAYMFIAIVTTIYLYIITSGLVANKYNSKLELVDFRKKTFWSTMISLALLILGSTILIMTVGNQEFNMFVFFSMLPVVSLLNLIVCIKTEKLVYKEITQFNSSVKNKVVKINTQHQKQKAQELYDNGLITKEELAQLTKDNFTSDDLTKINKITNKTKIEELKNLKQSGIIDKDEFTKLIIDLI